MHIRKVAAGVLLGVMTVASSAFAKVINKGTTELTGGTNISFRSTSSDSYSTVSSLNLSLNGLYYLAPNTGLGITMGYTSDTGGGETVSSLMLGPMASFNFSISENASLFLNGKVGVANASTENATYSGWFAGAATGVKYFFNKNISANLGISYRHIDQNSSSSDYFYNGDYNSDSIACAVGFSFYLNTAE